MGGCISLDDVMGCCVSRNGCDVTNRKQAVAAADLPEKSPQEHAISPASSPVATATVYQFTEKIVNDFIYQYVEDFSAIARANPSPDAWKAFWSNHITDDYLLIRPSGNPLDLNGLVNMFASGDVTNFSESIVAVESIKLLGDCKTVAVVVYKTEQLFVYKGNEEEDLATWTVVLVADPKSRRPKMTNVHRSTGKGINHVHK